MTSTRELIWMVPVLMLWACAAPASAPQRPAGRLAEPEPLRPLQARPAPAATVPATDTAGADAGPRLSLLRRGHADAGTPDVAPASQPTALSVPSIGVLACDAYLQRYFTCIQSRLPQSTQGKILKSLQTVADAWRKAAATPAGRQGLQQACLTATQATKQAMKSFGCQW